MITYLTGDATEPRSDGHKVIVHVCNDLGRWGKGFVLPLGRKFPGARSLYLSQSRWPAGSVTFYTKGDVTVANVIGQHLVWSIGGVPPIRYEWLRDGLATVSKFVRGLGEHATIHCPRIGCGLAGGQWDLVEPIIDEELNGLDVFVYDLK